MLLNVSQAARELGVSTETVRRNIRAKRWPFYRLGPKTTRVDVEEIRALNGVPEGERDTTFLNLRPSSETPTFPRTLQKS